MHRPTTRRSFLMATTLGAASIAVGADRVSAAVAAAPTGRNTSATDTATSCLSLTPTQEVGPFYVAYDRVREDIRGGQTGVPLLLHIRIINVSTCEPIQHAALDIWHANRLGKYSDEASEDTTGKTWLRGVQLTAKDGRVTFRTIMPGWYDGRVNHIHAKVRVKGTVTNHLYSGGTTAHIGQMFFAQKVNDACASLAEYAANQQKRITDTEDRVYTRQGGTRSHITVAGSPAKGYVGHITLGVQP